jgi:DNA-binding NtrC family response regulator
MNEMSLLYVEDDKRCREVLADVMRRYPSLTVYEADNADEGLEKFITLRPEIVITDIVMSGHNGIWLIEQIRKISKDTLILIMSAYYDPTDMFDPPGIMAIPKPIEPKYLLSIIANCAEHVKLNREFKSLVGVIVNGTVI